MSWKLLGLVWVPDGRHQWMHSHATLPTPLLLSDRIRVFIQTRDGENRSRIAYVDVDRYDPTKVLAVSATPVLDLGPLGRFDDNGVAPSCAVSVGDITYLYFVGLSPRVTVPVHLAIGLAVSHDGGNRFERVYPGPIVDCNPHEPFLFTSPTVLHVKDRWHMWYTSGTGFVMQNGKPEMLYHIKYAQSVDGVSWQRDNVSCVLPADALEVTARPAVHYADGQWRMWYCYRGSRDFRDGVDSYRIGFATGHSETNWLRQDARPGIHPVPSDWDATMQAYPAVLEVDGRLLLFYNGNGFGRTGFGCAVWEQD